MKSIRPIIALMFLALLAAATPAQQLRDVFRRVNPSVVVVHTEQKTPPAPVANGAPEGAVSEQGVGSGILISADGKVLTAAHVVQAARRVEVEFLGGQRWPARVIASAPFADVALLQLTTVPANVIAAKLGDSDKAEPGDQVFVIGAPYGVSHSLAVGHLSARRAPERIFENLTALELFQVDVALFQGNSGGPVFNLDGEVIGIVSSVLSKSGVTHGPGFAVTANVARKLMLEEKRLWMGVEALLIEGPMAAAFNLPQAAGMLVQSVADGSLGARLGLHEGKLHMVIEEQPLLAGGDVILELLGRPVRPDPAAFQALQALLDQLKPGEAVTMKVLRQGQIVELSTRISE